MITWLRGLALVVTVAVVGVACSSDDDNVVATGPGFELALSEVVASLDDEPPGVGDLEGAYTTEQLNQRLTSMLQLRLVAVAMTDLGIEVPLGGTDAELNDRVEEAQPRFREQAIEEHLADNPGDIARISPNCLNAILIEDPAEVDGVLARIEGGEDFAAVADDVNTPGSVAPGGDLGCEQFLDWNPDISAAIEGLEEGDVTEPIEVPTAAGAPVTLVVRVREIQDDQLDVERLGDVASTRLAAQMRTYEVTVDDDLGVWDTDSLRIAAAT